jgi:hypothetical protein
MPTPSVFFCSNPGASASIKTFCPCIKVAKWPTARAEWACKENHYTGQSPSDIGSRLLLAQRSSYLLPYMRLRPGGEYYLNLLSASRQTSDSYDRLVKETIFCGLFHKGRVISRVNSLD